jgi:hypothetical protein
MTCTETVIQSTARATQLWLAKPFQKRSFVSKPMATRPLTFLFAILHAWQAVEFFFGRLTAVDDCGVSMTGGPGASGGNGLELPV